MIGLGGITDSLDYIEDCVPYGKQILNFPGFRGASKRT